MLQFSEELSLFRFNPNRVRFGDWGAALVALSGPITNLVIALFAFGVGVF